MNIDLKEDEREPLTPEQEKWVKALRDVERVRKIRQNAEKALEEGEADEIPEEVYLSGAEADSGRRSAPGNAKRRSSSRSRTSQGRGAGQDSGKRRGKRNGTKKGRLVPRLLLFFVLCFCLFLFTSLRRPKKPAEILKAETPKEEEVLLPEKGFYTVAVFGVDSRDGSLEKGALADVNMIAALNWETGELRLVSVYRDTYLQINEKGTFHKFNEAYFKGGPEQAIWAMRHNLDLVPDDYVTFNWKSVIDAINIMGGVDIEITEPEFFYINAFITETVNATGIGSVQLKKAGMNHLDGVQAVAYARLRLMDTDFQRTERQRKVVKLLVDKIKKADMKKRIELVTSVLPETRTSITVNDLLPFVNVKNIRKFYLGETAGFPFDLKTTYINRMDCVVPVTLESNVEKLHEFLYDEKNFKAGKSVKEVSDKIVKKTGMKAEKK